MFRPSIPTPTGNTLDAVTDIDSGSWANDLSAYRAFLIANTLVADAMGYSSLDSATQDAIWSAVDAAETGGGVADISDPADAPALPFSTPGPYDTICALTDAEARAIYGAKVAHALYLEVHRAVPWSIADHDLTALRGLFDPDWLFDSWSFPNGCELTLVIDHSPSRAYAEASPHIGSATTAKGALSNLLNAIGPTTRHSTPADPLWALTMDKARDYNAAGDPATISNKAVNRTGCHFAGRVFRRLARAINISCEPIRGHYYGSAHESAGFPHAGLVLGHGDDIAIDDFNERPGIEYLDDYDYWQTDVIGEADTWLKKQRTASLFASRYMSWFGSTAKWRMTGGDWLLLEDFILPWSEYAIMDAWYRGLVAITGSDGLPDKPSPSNTGTTGALTPTSGRVIDASISDEEITGGLTINATGGFIDIRNCKIDGLGGVGLNITAARWVRVFDCEFTNCSVGISGVPADIYNCYFHGNGTNAQLEGAGEDNEPLNVAISYFGDTTGINVRIDGADEMVLLRHCTLVSTASAPVVQSNAGMVRGLRIHRCYIDGGTYAVALGQFSGVATQITDCQLGRSSTSGLLSWAGLAPSWENNVYEDNGSVASEGDTAPL